MAKYRDLYGRMTTLCIVLGIGMLFLLVFFQGDIIHHPTVVRKMSYFSNMAGVGRHPVTDNNPTTSTPDTDIVTSSTTEPPLILRKNFDRHYDIMATHEKRRRRMQSMCDNSTNGYLGDSKEKAVAANLHIDQRHHLVYCQVQKVGSTFIRSILAKVNKATKNVDDRWAKLDRLSDLNNIGFAQLHSALINSFKFMFTREPYSRLLSGYVDKLFTVNTLYWKSIGVHIKYTVLNTEESIKKCGHDITFPQFIKYIIQSEATGVRTDRHFTPIYEHCRPCQISYDFIGKMETFTNDTRILMNAWGKRYGITISYDDFEAETGLERALNHAGRLYKMKNGIEKCTSFYSAMKRTWKDLQIRGLLSKHAPLPFAEVVSRVEYEDALEKAIKETSNDPIALKKQRMEALIQAYSKVPMEDLYKLREIVRPDCELFGYEETPTYIFDRGDWTYDNDAILFQYFDY